MKNEAAMIHTIEVIFFPFKRRVSCATSNIPWISSFQYKLKKYKLHFKENLLNEDHVLKI